MGLTKNARTRGDIESFEIKVASLKFDVSGFLNSEDQYWFLFHNNELARIPQSPQVLNCLFLSFFFRVKIQQASSAKQGDSEPERNETRRRVEEVNLRNSLKYQYRYNLT